MTLTDYRSYYDKDFIGAWDLEGGDLTVTIKKCTGGNLTAPGGRKSKRPVVYMTHTEKGFVLNSTNGKTIATLYGNYVEKWPGKRITLYKSMTHSPGSDGEIECIRVRPSVPGEDTKTAAPQAPTPPVPPSGEPAVAAAPTDDSLTKDIETWVKRKKFDTAYDLARDIKNLAKREEVNAKIDRAKAYVEQRG